MTCVSGVEAKLLSMVVAVRVPLHWIEFICMCGSDGKESPCNAGDSGSIHGSGRSSGNGNGNPLSVFSPREFHGQRSLAGYGVAKKQDGTTNTHN